MSYFKQRKSNWRKKMHYPVLLKQYIPKNPAIFERTDQEKILTEPNKLNFSESSNFLPINKREDIQKAQNTEEKMSYMKKKNKKKNITIEHKRKVQNKSKFLFEEENKEEKNQCDLNNPHYTEKKEEVLNNPVSKDKFNSEFLHFKQEKNEYQEKYEKNMREMKYELSKLILMMQDIYLRMGSNLNIHYEIDSLK